MGKILDWWPIVLGFALLTIGLGLQSSYVVLVSVVVIGLGVIKESL